MNETCSTLSKISQSLENGVFDSPNSTNQTNKNPIEQLGDQLKNTLHESESIRGRLELKDEELIELKKLIKLKHDELSELNIRLSLNEKKIENLQRELDEKTNKHKQALEEGRIDAQKKIKLAFSLFV